MEKGLSDNGRAAIGYVCLALCFLGWIGIFWTLNIANGEFVFKIEMDDNTLDAFIVVEEGGVWNRTDKGHLNSGDKRRTIEIKDGECLSNRFENHSFYQTTEGFGIFNNSDPRLDDCKSFDELREKRMSEVQENDK